MAKIGDVFVFIRNGANIKQGTDDTGYPITRIETISNRTIDRSKMGYAGITDIKKYEDYVLKDGDILMSHINSETHLGKVALYIKQNNETIIHGMNLLCLRCAEKLNSKFAFYYLSSDSFLRQIPKITKKSVNQASFTVTAVKELIIPVPSLEEQKNIAGTLDKVTALIALRKKQLEKLDELVKSRFVEMFGDLMLNPYEWPVVKISDVSLLLKSGLSRKLSDDDIGLPVIRSGNIQNGQFIYDDIKYWYKEDPQGSKTEDYILEDGDILVNFINSASQIGKTAIFRDVGRDCIYTTNIFRMKLSEKCNEYYYNWFAMTDYYYRQLQNIIQPAVNQASFTTVNFLKLNIPLPPMELQTQFSTFVTQTDKSKLAVQKSLEQLETLKKSLMQKYFG